MFKVIMLIVFICLIPFFYLYDFNVDDDLNVFLTIATFTFAVFTGFFMSRQSKRYNDIRNSFADLNGILSNLYRLYRLMSLEAQKEYVKIIKREYKPVLEGDWKHLFFKKIKFISEMYRIIEEKADKKNPFHIRISADILRDVGFLQRLRKRIIVLTNEKIPFFQWIIIIILSSILLISIILIASAGSMLLAVIKSAFLSAIVIVIYLLYQFDRLKFFEKVIGESASIDVMDIIKGKK